jgi:hypothetical protein
MKRTKAYLDQVPNQTSRDNLRLPETSRVGVTGFARVCVCGFGLDTCALEKSLR